MSCSSGHATFEPGPSWSDAIDEIFDSDQVVALGYLTPANGVVITPLTNFGVRDRKRGTLSSINSSIGVPTKLERLRHEPKIALAYHTRHLSFTDRPEYVLVQGTATLAPPRRDYPRSIRGAWERFGGPVEVGRLWDWWLRVYSTRVEITIAVDRLIVWPSLSCEGEPAVIGAPLPAVAPQSPPKKGTGPRINHRRAARRAWSLPHRLLGWAGGDGYPVVLPVTPAGVEEAGIVFDAPELLPPGGRRAGLMAHSFTRYAAGQHQRKHTGWVVRRDDGTAVYAPHTERGYRTPDSMLVFRLVAGGGTRLGLRGVRLPG